VNRVRFALREVRNDAVGEAFLQRDSMERQCTSIGESLGRQNDESSVFERADAST
jgi:hypothetical protein